MRLSLFGRSGRRLHPLTAITILGCLNMARYRDGTYVEWRLSRIAWQLAASPFGGAVPPWTPEALRLAKVMSWAPKGRYLS